MDQKSRVTTEKLIMTYASQELKKRLQDAKIGAFDAFICVRNTSWSELRDDIMDVEIGLGLWTPVTSTEFALTESLKMMHKGTPYIQRMTIYDLEDMEYEEHGTIFD